MAGMALLVAVYTGLSWFFFVTQHLALRSPHTAFQLLLLPTDFPSVWDVALPTLTGSAAIPLLGLLIQAALTGGLYGGLVRVNTGLPANPATFVSDAIRAFWRLLFWNLIWFAATLIAYGLSHALPAFSVVFGCLLLVLRFLFIFADTAIVCEQQATVREAVSRAAQTLMGNLATMLPIGLAMALAASLTAYLVSATPVGAGILISVAYGLVMLWLIHMVVSRYVVYANWTQREAMLAG